MNLNTFTVNNFYIVCIHFFLCFLELNEVVPDYLCRPQKLVAVLAHFLVAFIIIQIVESVRRTRFW